MNIAHLDCETTASHVTDNGNNLWGTIFINSFGSTPIVSGYANGKAINMRLQPGPWAGQPAAPATGVAQQNTSWHDAAIYVSATTAITAVKVDGTTIPGLTAAIGVAVCVIVPSGHTYTVTAVAGVLTTEWIIL
jgi:hypothetical protein